MPPCNPAIQAVVEENNYFSFDLCKEAIKNLVMSASSVSTVLAMLVAGAEGNTLMQIRNSLNLPEGSTTHDGYRCLLPQLSSNDFDLNVANGIFVMEGFRPKMTFLETVQGSYYSSVICGFDLLQIKWLPIRSTLGLRSRPCKRSRT